MRGWGRKPRTSCSYCGEQIRDNYCTLIINEKYFRSSIGGWGYWKTWDPGIWDLGLRGWASGVLKAACGLSVGWL